jgi:hypothetical protein
MVPRGRSYGSLECEGAEACISYLMSMDCGSKVGGILGQVRISEEPLAVVVAPISFFGPRGQEEDPVRNLA